MRLHVALPGKSVVIGFDGVAEFDRLRSECRRPRSVVSVRQSKLRELADLMDARAEDFSPQQTLPDIEPGAQEGVN